MLGPMMKEQKDRELLDTLKRMEERYKKHIDQWGPIYESGRNYVFANQLREHDVKAGWERIQVNLVFPAVVQEQSLLAQRRATIVTLPFEQGDEAGADFWSKQLQWQYENALDVPMLLLRGILDGKTHGHWVVEAWWDAEAEWDEEEERWAGAVKAKLRRPEAVCMDPDSDSVDDLEWVYAIEEVPVDEAVEKWPSFKTEIERESLGAKVDAGEDNIGRLKEHIKGPRRTDRGEIIRDTSDGRLADMLAPIPSDRQDSVRESQVTRTVPVMRALFRDRSRIDSKVERKYTGQEIIDQGMAELRPDPKDPEAPPGYFDLATGEPLTEANWPKEEREVRRPKYPHGRYVVRIGETVVEDRAWEYRNWPYAIGHNLLLPHTVHGLNGVEMPKGLQDFINVCARHMVNYVKFFGDPITAVEENTVAGSPENKGVAGKLRATAGAIWKLAQGGLKRIERFAPPPMSEGVLKIYDMMAREARDQTGVHEIALGRQAKGNMTATESMELATNSKMRTALQSILMEHFVLRLMRRVQELCQRNMTVGQMVRIGGEEAQNLLMAIPEGAVEARFDLSLKVTTGLPFDQEREQVKWTQLFQLLGLPVLEQLLDAYEVEGKAEILEAVQVYQALKAAVEQQREQQAQGEQNVEATGQAAA